MNAVLAILPKLSPVKQIAPGIIRILGNNPGSLTYQGTNSYLLGSGSSVKSRFLIDTSDFLCGNYIKNTIEIVLNMERGSYISHILLTHWHDDHVGAARQLQEALKSATGVTSEILKYPSNEKHKTINFKHGNLSHNQSFDVPGLGPLQIIHTPGHTDDHICLFLPKQKFLFTGDLILGNGSTSFEYLNSYMKSLHLINGMKDSVQCILPGHGQVILDPPDKIQDYISHRIERISDVYNFLQASSWRTERELVHFIYQDVNDQLMSMCLSNQKQALIYLEKQKMIESSPLTEMGDFETTHSLSKKWRRVRNSPDSFPIAFD